MKSGRDRTNVITLAAAIALLSLTVGCTDERSRNRELVGQWLGREIVMPSELVYQIQHDTVGIDLSRPDFKIVNYVDSSGCTSCRMKLSRWSEVIDELKSIAECSLKFPIWELIMDKYNQNDNVCVKFCMLLSANHKDINEILFLSRKNKFKYPITVFADTVYNFKNLISCDKRLHTFLMDKDNRILAIGNPTINPKINDLFMQIINK